MAATYMTDKEFEQFEIQTVMEISRAMSRAIDRGASEYFFFLAEKLDRAQGALVDKFGWTWEDVEALEVLAY